MQRRSRAERPGGFAMGCTSGHDQNRAARRISTARRAAVEQQYSGQDRLQNDQVLEPLIACEKTEEAEGKRCCASNRLPAY